LALARYTYINIDTFNPIASGNFGILFLWAYYYYLISGIDYLVKLRTKRSAEGT